MNRKLAVTIMFFFLGLTTWDAFLDKDDSRVGGGASEVRAFEDCTGMPPATP